MTEQSWTEALASEGERVEWKQSVDAEDLLRAASALANDLGETGRAGFILLGIDNRGAAIGIDASDKAQQRIVGRLTSTRILPNPSCSVFVETHQDLPIIVIRVEPYAVPPPVTVDGVAWVRVGPTTRRATDADLARLRERRPESASPFDLRVVPGAALHDLDLVALRNLYEADRRIDNEPDTFPGLEPWLGQKGIVRRAGGAWMPTAAGVLVWGLDPQSQFPGATIEFARYAGTDFDAALVTRRTSAGRLADQLETLWAQLQANVAEVPAEAVGIRTPVVPEYPVDALKELARNLVQHRLYDGTNAPGRVSWFDDRIVFNNPGQPFGHASDGEFGEHSDYRNPTITRLLMEAGYVERLGRGVRKVRALLQKNGNPPLDVQTNGYTTVMVGRRR